MVITDTISVVLLAVIAAALIVIAVALFSFIKIIAAQGVATQKVSESIERAPDQQLRERTEANLRILADRNALYAFVLSEAAIDQALNDIDDKELDTFIESEINQSKKGVWERTKGWFNKNKAKIAEKLFDKLNDVAKGFIPGTSKK